MGNAPNAVADVAENGDVRRGGEECATRVKGSDVRLLAAIAGKPTRL